VKTSENGELLTEMAISCGLRVENTFYRKKLSQRTSWTHPATSRRSLLDLFLMKNIELIGTRTSKATQDLTVVPTTIW
jgi:hypothetical protein